MYNDSARKATVQQEQYEKIKAYADSQGKPVNTVLKEIIFEKVGITS